MKISIDRLKEIILEEINSTAEVAIGECGADMEVMDMEDPEGFEGPSEEGTDGDIEDLVVRAMEAIQDLASAAGAEISTTVDAYDHDEEEIEIVEDE